MQELTFIKEQYEKYQDNSQDIYGLQQSIGKSESALFFQNYMYHQNNQAMEQIEQLQHRFIGQYLKDSSQHALLLSKLISKDTLFIEIFIDCFRTLLKKSYRKEELPLLYQCLVMVKETFHIEEVVAKSHLQLLKPLAKLLLSLEHGEFSSLAKECLLVWNTLFSLKHNGFYYALFQTAYTHLIDQGMSFPTSLKYFQIDLV